VTLPLVQQVDHAPQAAEAAAPAADEPQPGLDIVVADDNADAAETLAQLLEAMGHRVRTAADGAAAVRLVLQHRPQLAILDIGMPELDGLEACKQIVAAGGAARPMLVALTGWGQSQDIARSGKAGFDRHLVKPVDAQQLEQLLADCAERVPGPAANGARSQR
jgi:CheY-like chemotaxis protein